MTVLVKVVRVNAASGPAEHRTSLPMSGVY
jgi:hypothetical protein